MLETLVKESQKNILVGASVLVRGRNARVLRQSNYVQPAQHISIQLIFIV